MYGKGRKRKERKKEIKEGKSNNRRHREGNERKKTKKGWRKERMRMEEFLCSISFGFLPSFDAHIGNEEEREIERRGQTE